MNLTQSNRCLQVTNCYATLVAGVLQLLALFKMTVMVRNLRSLQFEGLAYHLHWGS